MIKVCLDAGHGGKDSGAAALGRKEKDDVLRMTLRVGQILAANGIDVFYNRTADVFESVDVKARKANNAKVDFFASFHRNAYTGAAKGNETLVYANVGKAKVCADRANIRMQEIGFVQRGTKINKGIAVLNSTQMEAVLFETGFIDNTEDNALFDRCFETIAQGYAEAILLAVGQQISDTPTTPPAAPSQPMPPQPPSSTIDIDYAVMIEGGRKLPVVRNLNDFAGIIGKRIVGFMCKVSSGSIKYRAHLKGKGWLPWVTGFDWNDFNNGYAGDGKTPIDAIEVYLYSPNGDKYVFYRVSPMNGNYYPYQRDTDKGKGMDGYAGVLGKEIDRIQMFIE